MFKNERSDLLVDIPEMFKGKSLQCFRGQCLKSPYNEESTAGVTTVLNFTICSNQNCTTLDTDKKFKMKLWEKSS